MDTGKAIRIAVLGLLGIPAGVLTALVLSLAVLLFGDFIEAYGEFFILFVGPIVGAGIGACVGAAIRED